MDRIEPIDIEELGIASVETLGDIPQNPEPDGLRFLPGGGISAD